MSTLQINSSDQEASEAESDIKNEHPRMMLRSQGVKRKHEQEEVTNGKLLRHGIIENEPDAHFDNKDSFNESSGSMDNSESEKTEHQSISNHFEAFNLEEPDTPTQIVLNKTSMICKSPIVNEKESENNDNSVEKLTSINVVEVSGYEPISYLNDTMAMEHTTQLKKSENYNDDKVFANEIIFQSTESKSRNSLPQISDLNMEESHLSQFRFNKAYDESTTNIAIVNEENGEDDPCDSISNIEVKADLTSRLIEDKESGSLHLIVKDSEIEDNALSSESYSNLLNLNSEVNLEQSLQLNLDHEENRSPELSSLETTNKMLTCENSSSRIDEEIISINEADDEITSESKNHEICDSLEKLSNAYVEREALGCESELNETDVVYNSNIKIDKQSVSENECSNVLHSQMELEPINGELNLSKDDVKINLEMTEIVNKTSDANTEMDAAGSNSDKLNKKILNEADSKLCEMFQSNEEPVSSVQDATVTECIASNCDIQQEITESVTSRRTKTDYVPLKQKTIMEIQKENIKLTVQEVITPVPAASVDLLTSHVPSLSLDREPATSTGVGALAPVVAVNATRAQTANGKNIEKEMEEPRGGENMTLGESNSDSDPNPTNYEVSKMVEEVSESIAKLTTKKKQLSGAQRRKLKRLHLQSKQAAAQDAPKEFSDTPSTFTEAAKRIRSPEEHNIASSKLESLIEAPQKGVSRQNPLVKGDNVDPITKKVRTAPELSGKTGDSKKKPQSTRKREVAAETGKESPSYAKIAKQHYRDELCYAVIDSSSASGKIPKDQHDKKDSTSKSDSSTANVPVHTQRGMSKGDNHIRPSKVKHMEKRAALKVKARLEKLGYQKLNDAQKESLKWARNILAARDGPAETETEETHKPPVALGVEQTKMKVRLNVVDLTLDETVADTAAVVQVPTNPASNITVDLTLNKNKTSSGTQKSSKESSLRSNEKSSMSSTETRSAKELALNKKNQTTTNKTSVDINLADSDESKNDSDIFSLGELPKSAKGMRRRYYRSCNTLERIRKADPKTLSMDDITSWKRSEAYVRWFENETRNDGMVTSNIGNADDKSTGVAVDNQRNRTTRFDITPQATPTKTRFDVLQRQVVQSNSTSLTLPLDVSRLYGTFAQSTWSQAKNNSTNFNYCQTGTTMTPMINPGNVNCNSNWSFVQNESLSSNQFASDIAATTNNYPWYQQTTHIAKQLELASNSLTNPPSKIKVAIVDLRNTKVRIEDDQWESIEEKLLQALISEINNKDMQDIFTAFNGFKWENGVKVIECDNRKAVHFLKETLHSLGPLTEFIEVLPSEMVLDRKVVCVTIPPPIPNAEMLLKLLKKQNRDLKADSWTIQETQTICGNVKVYLDVSFESSELIKRSKGMIKFGLTNHQVTYPATKEDTEKKSRWR